MEAERTEQVVEVNRLPFGRERDVEDVVSGRLHWKHNKNKNKNVKAHGPFIKYSGLLLLNHKHKLKKIWTLEQEELFCCNKTCLFYEMSLITGYQVSQICV